MRKLSLILAMLLVLCSCAFAETVETPVITAEDIQGLWILEYAVADGIQVSAQAYGLTVTMILNEDGTAVLDYGDDNPVEMTWRIEEGKAWLTGYIPEEDVEMVIAEEGFLDIEDEIGKMHFSRPVEEAEAK